MLKGGVTGLRYLALIVALVTLAGCASLPPPAEPAVRPPRERVTAFQLEGRIVVRRGEENFSAHVSWQHGPRSEEIVLSTPLGQGMARLTADAHGAQLETADQKRYAAADLDSLSEQVFGVRLPITAIPRWVVGRGAPSPGARELDARGRLTRFVEQGWEVEFVAYENETANALPNLLRLEQNDVQVRLKIDAWSVNP